MGDLILIMGQTPDEAWDCLATDSGEIIRAVSKTEKSALRETRYNRLIVIIPGEHVTIKPHTLANLNARQKRQAAGYAIEDSLAATLDDTHIALDPHADRLAVVAHTVMEDMLAALSEYGLYPDRIYADYDLLTGEESIVLGERILVHHENGMGFAAETELAGALLEPGQNLPGAISLTDYFGRVLHTLSAESSAGTPQPINLLQPPYRAQPLSGFGAYKRVFALLAAVFLAFIVVNLAQGWTMARKTKSVRAEINTLYTKTFPGEKIPANPLKALRKKLAGAGSSDRQQFLRLSSLLFQAVSKTKGVEIESLRYDARKGELSVSLRYPDFEKVEKLKQAVQQAGGRFSESGVRQSRDGLMGEAVVRAGT